MSEVNRSSNMRVFTSNTRPLAQSPNRIIVTEKAKVDSDHDPRPLYIEESQPEEYSIKQKFKIKKVNQPCKM